ncbi:hypothetical protein [Peribacillus frigoritolerans]|uniref:Uncharacterized protein n=1 Tax=Peribacillus frigoritolerans TaxID=450367 RepID=A0AAJ1QQ10_9BACI|nr:hypothetical protein [Peribacillus frigoritolerans]MDM5285654.1 hypothetical protein [Peribacillus frigoritolerans]
MAGAANAESVRARKTLENSDWKSHMNEEKEDMRGLSRDLENKTSLRQLERCSYVA